MSAYEATKVKTTETSEVIHTSWVSGRLEVDLVGVAVARLRDRLVDEVAEGARDDHQDAHDEDPRQELDLDGRVVDREQDERR